MAHENCTSLTVGIQTPKRKFATEQFSTFAVLPALVKQDISHREVLVLHTVIWSKLRKALVDPGSGWTEGGENPSRPDSSPQLLTFWSFFFGHLRRVPVEREHNRHPLPKVRVQQVLHENGAQLCSFWFVDLFLVKDKAPGQKLIQMASL